MRTAKHGALWDSPPGSDSPMLFLYNVLVFLASPVLFVWLLVRLWLRGGGLRAMRERFGLVPRLPQAGGGRLWVHAVSVGEVGVAAVLIPVLLRVMPDVKIVLSTVTQTGRSAAEKIAGVERLFYLPFDFAPIVHLALARVRPSAVALVETEIWPNLVWAAAGRGISVSIVNGRLSARSHRRYARLGFFFSRVLGRVRDVLARGEADAARFRELGAASVYVSGNVKFDTPLPGAGPSPAAYGLAAGACVVVAGSTHPGEEELIGEALASIRRKTPEVCLLLAPRHPERVGQVEAALRSVGLSPVRWSETRGANRAHDVVILDAMGELADAYACAKVAVIGGSFVPHGGQNPIEAARWSVPCLFGPHMQNFAEVADELLEGGGAVRAEGCESLEAALARWLGDPHSRKQAGEAARRVVENNRGAAERTAQYIARTIERLNGDAA